MAMFGTNVIPEPKPCMAVIQLISHIETSGVHADIFQLASAISTKPNTSSFRGSVSANTVPLATDTTYDMHISALNNILSGSCGPGMDSEANLTFTTSAAFL